MVHARSPRDVALLALLALSLLAPPAAVSLERVDPIWRRVGSLNPTPEGFAITDAARNRLLLLVSDGADDMVGEWEIPLDGPAELRELPVDGLPPRRIAAPVLDPARNRILFMDLDYVLDTVRVGALELLPTPRWTTLSTTGDLGTLDGKIGVLDVARDEYVLYESAGTYPIRAEVRRLDLQTNAWATPVVTGPQPPGRHRAVAVYDSRRHRMILHGGEDYYFPTPHRHDLWALSLGDTLSWTPLQLDGADAQAYAAHLGVYEPVHDRLIVYGGIGGSHSDVRAYAFETGRWSTLVPPGPLPGERARAIYALDSAHDRIWMGGGLVGQQATDIVLWTLDLGVAPAWTRALDPGPVGYPRAGCASVWDTRGNRAIVWGGRRTSYIHHDYWADYTTDTWALSFGARPQWTLLVSDNPPSARQHSTMVYDETGNAAWVFGGTLTYPWRRLGVTYNIPSAWYGDTWRLDLAGQPNWTRVVTESPGPSPREGHAMTLDAVNRRLLVYGGRDSLTAALDDLWALSLDPPYRWTLIVPDGPQPAPRVFPVLACDAGGRRMLLFGGQAANGSSLDDTWALPLDGSAGWQPLAATGAPPRTAGPRPAAWDGSRSRLIVFGEGNALVPSPAQRVWALDLASSPAWSEFTIGGIPQRDRAAAAAVFDPAHDQALLLGGGQGPALENGSGGPARLVFGLAAPSVTTIEFLDASAEPDRVKLAWAVADGPGFRATIDRREEGTAWRPLAEVRPEPGGRVQYVDATVEAGHRYAYRLAWGDDAGWGISPELWIPVPVWRFALEPPRPNPAGDRLELAFALPDREPARLELIDIAGRVVMRRTVTAPAGGTGIEPITVSGLPAGIYAVRLSHAVSSLQRRVIILH